mgnify:CR=1 FL=1
MSPHRRALRFSLLLTLVMFVTGLATIPWASQFHPLMQNFLYAVGRIPLIYVVVFVFWGTGDEARG